jgi:hypothetical protein
MRSSSSVKKVAPIAATVAAKPKSAYLIGPESYGTFKMIAQLQKAQRAGVSRFESPSTLRRAQRRAKYAPGHLGDPVDGCVASRSSRNTARSLASPSRAWIHRHRSKASD